MTNPLQLIVGFLLGFILPGYTLVKALFPRKEELDVNYGGFYQLILGIGMSITIMILLAFVLGNPGVKLFSTYWLMLFLTLTTVALFLVGWLRGAYPIMGAIHPSLERFPQARDVVEYEVGRSVEKEDLFDFQKLARERFKIRNEIDDYERKIKVQPKSISGYYERKKKEALERLENIDKKMRSIEGKKW